MKFGLIPEFVGRLPVVVTLESLDKDALINILTKPKNALVKQYKKLFEIDNVQLNFTDEALEAIANEARRQIEVYESGKDIVQASRSFNPLTGGSSFMRNKENAIEYRYFPDPDLAPLYITDELIEEIQSKRNSYMSELMEMAKKENFEVKVTNKGFAFIPLINGKVISEREYDNLDREKKEVIVAKASILKKKAEVVLVKIKDIEVKSISKLKEVYSDFLTKEMEDYKDEILFQFIDDDSAYEYLEKLFSLMEKDIIECYTMDIDEDEEKLYDVINKYNIHLLVDNSITYHPPVIYEEDPSVNNLMGFLEYENHNGVYTTDISLINSGSLLQANGGCLIIS